jgi:cell division protein FtsB
VRVLGRPTDQSALWESGLRRSVRINVEPTDEVSKSLPRKLARDPETPGSQKLLALTALMGLRWPLSMARGVGGALGTEPVARIYCAAPSQPELDEMVKTSRSFVLGSKRRAGTGLVPGGRRSKGRTMVKLFTRDRRAYFGTLAAAVSLVAGLGYHVICGEHGYLALRREKQQYESLRKQTDQIQQENDRLQKDITALKSDPKTIEKRAREDSLMAKPGEIIIRYSDAKPKASGASAGKDTPSDAAPPAPAR